MYKKSFRIVALLLFLLHFSVDSTFSQRSHGRSYNRSLNGLNLSPQQTEDLKKLQEENFIQRNRMKDNMKKEMRSHREHHDKKLRSILSEKQYYAYKHKMKENRKKQLRKHQNNLKRQRHDHKGRYDRQYDKF